MNLFSSVCPQCMCGVYIVILMYAVWRNHRTFLLVISKPSFDKQTLNCRFKNIPKNSVPICFPILVSKCNLAKVRQRTRRNEFPASATKFWALSSKLAGLAPCTACLKNQIATLSGLYPTDETQSCSSSCNTAKPTNCITRSEYNHCYTDHSNETSTNCVFPSSKKTLVRRIFFSSPFFFFRNWSFYFGVLHHSLYPIFEFNCFSCVTCLITDFFLLNRKYRKKPCLIF